MKKVGILTSIDQYPFIQDEKILYEKASQFNLDLRPILWDKVVEHSDLDAFVIRTPWDYIFKSSEFLNILKNLKQPVFNSYELVKWNLDKHYLFEIQPVPLTQKFDPNKKFDFDVVIKPFISSTGFETFLIKTGEAYPNLSLDPSHYLIQEYLPSIMNEGEFSLIYLDGQYSHAVHKKGKTGEFKIHEEHGGSVFAYEALKTQIDLGYEVLKYIPFKDWLYARVDLVRNKKDQWVVMELEMIEPELFFRHCPKAAETLLTAINRRLT